MISRHISISAWVTVAGAAALGLATGFADPAEARDLRLLSSWDSSYPVVNHVLHPFLETLDEAVTTELGMTVMGPETVPPFEQFDPVSRGLFDLLFTNGAYHFNETSTGMALDGLSGDTEALRAAGIWDAVDAEYQALGLKLIAVLYDLNGYHIMLKEPLGEDGLQGRRVRGTPIYHPAIDVLGGSPVVLPGGEIYPALERGVIDGAAWPTIGAMSYRWFEVADYMMRPSFGQVGHLVLMNLETWSGLPDETRAEIETAARTFEIEANALFDTLVAEESAALEEAGMSVTKLSDPLAEMLDQAWFSGVFDLAATQSAETIEKMRRLATEADLDG